MDANEAERRRFGIARCAFDKLMERDDGGGPPRLHRCPAGRDDD